MTPGRALLLFGLAGCDQVFGLERPPEPPPACADLTDHDEDGDGVVDPCDNCPGIANPEQKNEREVMASVAADDVGDLCDPEPMKPGDRLATLLTFEDPETMTDWTFVSGGWRISGDGMRTDGSATTAYEVALFKGAHPPLGRYVVEARIVFDDLVLTVPAEHAIGIIPTWIGGSAGPDAGSSECAVIQKWDGSRKTDHINAYINMGNEEEVGLQMSMLSSGAGYRVRARPSATAIECQFDGDRGDGGAVSSTGTIVDGQLAFESQKVGASIEYIAIYEVGP